MNDIEFTILLPIHRPPVFLPFSVNSVINQDLKQFELFIVCDGAPLETIKVAKQFAQHDNRIRVFVNPKGLRHGEAHRASALNYASGKYIAHIDDDSLWLSDHLSSMAIILENIDFVNVPLALVEEDLLLTLFVTSLAEIETRNKMLSEVFNVAAYSNVAYRLDAYQQLSEGWSPAPDNLPTDLYMWRKFLAKSDLRIATLQKITTLVFKGEKNDVSESAIKRVRHFSERIADHSFVERLRQAAWNNAIHELLKANTSLTSYNTLMAEGKNRWEAQSARWQTDRDWWEADSKRWQAAYAEVRNLLESEINKGDANLSDNCHKTETSQIKKISLKLKAIIEKCNPFRHT